MKTTDKIWLTLLILLPLIGVYRIGYGAWYTREVIVKPVGEEWVKYAQCKKDVDCAMTVSPECGTCSCPVYINRIFLGDYADAKAKLCENTPEKVCIQAICPQSRAGCVAGKCVGKRI